MDSYESLLPFIQELVTAQPRRRDFPRFRSFPPEVRDMIWHFAISDEDAPRYILQSGAAQVSQGPPALAHVCHESRHVAMKTGKMYRLEDGRLTWFRPETDVLLWGGNKLGLGELADHVQNIAIPHALVSNYDEATWTFDFLFDQINFDQLEHVHVEMSNTFTLTNKGWHPAIQKKLFDANTVVTPNLSDDTDEIHEKIDDVCTILPNDVATRWEECRTTALNDAKYWDDHMTAHLIFAWISTRMARVKEISDEGVEAVEDEDEILMHPSGIPWWEYLANNSPAFSRTFVFTRITDRERVRFTDYGFSI